MEYACVLGWEPQIAMSPPGAGAVPVSKSSAVVPAPEPVPPPAVGGTWFEARDRWTDAGERGYIAWLLKRHGTNIMAAAIEAGLDHSTLRKIIKRLGMRVGPAV